ncbi:MAG: RDD family protein [Aeromicrobium sp.]|uniref:RDD family protein n=1 Tax=Aeromicrobium sp. TaxID=1871063 RepID=UPI0039E30437
MTLHATVGRRISGYIVDVSLTCVSALPAFAAIGLSIVAVGNTENSHTTAFFVLLALAVALGIGLAVIQWALLARGGGTVGHRVAGYRLLDSDTAIAPGWSRAFGYLALRHIIESLTSVIGWTVTAILATRDPRRR